MTFFGKLPAPDNIKVDNDNVAGIAPPPNPAQVPNPIQPHPNKDQLGGDLVHHRQSESLHTLKLGDL